MNNFGERRRDTERRRSCTELFLALATAITVRSPIRRAWYTHRRGTRPRSPRIRQPGSTPAGGRSWRSGSSPRGPPGPWPPPPLHRATTSPSLASALRGAGASTSPLADTCAGERHPLPPGPDLGDLGQPGPNPRSRRHGRGVLVSRQNRPLDEAGPLPALRGGGRALGISRPTRTPVQQARPDEPISDAGARAVRQPTMAQDCGWFQASPQVHSVSQVPLLRELPFAVMHLLPCAVQIRSESRS